MTLKDSDDSVENIHSLKYHFKVLVLTVLYFNFMLLYTSEVNLYSCFTN